MSLHGKIQAKYINDWFEFLEKLKVTPIRPGYNKIMGTKTQSQNELINTFKTVNAGYQTMAQQLGMSTDIFKVNSKQLKSMDEKTRIDESDVFDN